MKDVYAVENHLRELLRGWPSLKIQVAIEFCSSYVGDDESRLEEVTGLSSLDGLGFMHPLCRLEDVLSPLDLDVDDRNQLAWTIPSFRKATFHLDLHALSDCAQRYASEDELESKTLELWLVRWMIFEEIFAFSVEIEPRTNPKSWSKAWAVFKPAATYWLCVIAAIAIGADHSAALGFAAFILMTACCKAFFYLYTKEVQKLLLLEESMRRAFACVTRDFPSPLEAQVAISRSMEIGAVWPHHLHDLVEKAKRRNFRRWL